MRKRRDPMTPIKRTGLALLVLAVLAPPVAAADQWLRGKGPGARGHGSGR